MISGLKKFVSEMLLFTAIFQQTYFRLKNCVSMLPHFQSHELIYQALLKGQIVINEFLKHSLGATYLHLFLHNSRLKSRNALCTRKTIDAEIFSNCTEKIEYLLQSLNRISSLHEKKPFRSN